MADDGMMGHGGHVDAMVVGGDIPMVGQFGVGFYSVHLILGEVRGIGDYKANEQYIWELVAGGPFAFTGTMDSRIIIEVCIYQSFSHHKKTT